MLILRLLGGLSAEAGHGPLTGRAAQKKPLALLSLLATAPAGTLSRDKLTGLLWPESDPERARHQLASAVYELRRATTPDTILSVGDDIQLDPEAMCSDVADMEAALREARWRDAVALYGGPFLDGFFVGGAPEFERWQERERARLARLHAGALRSLASEAEREGDRLGAVEWWGRLAELDPYSSEITHGLMRAQEAIGDYPGAVRSARSHAARVRAELGIAPDPSVIAYMDRASAHAATAIAEPPHPAGPARARPSRAWTFSEAEGATSPPLRAGVTSPAPRRRRHLLTILGVAASLGALGGLAWSVQGRVSSILETAPGPRSVAVLPFTVHGPDAAADYLGEGIAGEIITELTRVRGLTVISAGSAADARGSEKTTREIARELRVDAVVEGEVVRTGDSLRIDARLIDPRTARTIWARSYRGDLRQVLGLHRRVALDAAAGLRPGVPPEGQQRLPKPRPVDPQAYDAYLRGRHAAARRDTHSDQDAMRHYLGAIGADPLYAMPYAALATLYASTAFRGHRPDPTDYDRAERAARRALALDSTLAEPYVVLARVQLNRRYDWNASDGSLRRALALDPASAAAHNVIASRLVARGRFAEAIEARRRAMELDPLRPYVAGELAWVYYMARRFDEALELCRLVLSRDPGNATAHAVTGLVLSALGRHEEALAALREAGRLSGSGLVNRAAVVQALAAADRHDEARRALAELHAAAGERGVSPYRLAGIHLLLGEREEAISRLEEAFETGDGPLIWVNVDPVFDSLRDHPRFRALVRRMDLS